MKIVFATNNKHKLSEIKDILGNDFDIVSLKDIGCDVDIPETAETLEGNASIKSHYIYDNYHLNCFADDTGLEVDARIRYKSPAVGAKLYFDDNSVRVDFDVPVWAIAPGQSVVFYKNDLILGGGVIVGRT